MASDEFPARMAHRKFQLPQNFTAPPFRISTPAAGKGALMANERAIGPSPSPSSPPNIAKWEIAPISRLPPYFCPPREIGNEFTPSDSQLIGGE